MAQQVVTIIFNDSASQFNKDLTDYLNRNLSLAIKKGGLLFHFKIAKPKDLSDLRNKGIKRLPAMIINESYYIGVPDIVKEINFRIKSSTSEVAPKTEEEMIRSFQLNILGNPKINNDKDKKFVFDNDKDDDDKDDDTKELTAKLNNEVKRRGINNVNTNLQGDRNMENNGQARNMNRNQTTESDDEDYAPRANNLRSDDNLQIAIANANAKHAENGEANDQQDDAMLRNMLERIG